MSSPSSVFVVSDNPEGKLPTGVVALVDAAGNPHPAGAIPAPPAEGTYTLTATDGVLSWEEVE